MAEHRRIANLILNFRFLALAALMPFAAAGTLAQQTAAASPVAPIQDAQAAQAVTPSATSSAPAQEAPGTHILHLLVGRSLVISSPTPIKRISIADPSIAEAVVVNPYQVLLNGKTPGGVSLLIWDETDQSQTFEVSVDIDILSLSEKIREVFPSEPVLLETSKDVVMLSGHISSVETAGKILEIVKNSTTKVTSLMQVPDVPIGEILLQVKFAEVDRSAISQLGMNILRNFGTNMPLSVGTGQFAPFGFGTNQTTTTAPNGSTSTFNTDAFTISDLLNVAVFRPDLDLAMTIRALQNDNVLQILAEPNLMTESGKQASFLAGGEFPFPVLQGSVGATAGGASGITIQFKEFGVRLNFTPTLTADGLIHLNVKPEVSSLDYANALTIQGFVIPALSTRRAESDMELRDGQSFAIAGLIDNRVSQQFEKIPGIGDIPILGKLFQSRSLTKSKDELLILVTPRIVHPLQVGDKLPALVYPKPFLGPTVSEKKKSPDAAPAQEKSSDTK
jgi:pilus assembly protein CpaC